MIEGIAKIGSELQLGCALNPESQHGPLMSARQLAQVSDMVEAARKAGVNVVSGGVRSGEHGDFYTPTVLSKVNPALPIVRDEIFGPVLCKMPFKDDGEGLAKANDTSFGLAASIWTRDSDRAHRMANGVKAGALAQSFGVFDPDLPFGG